MKTISMVMALALGTGAGLALGHGPHWRVGATAATTKIPPIGASNAAFRDGLYQAKLALARGSGAHVATGRWNSEEDRASFAAGYQQGFTPASGGGTQGAGRNAQGV